jgi:uncharacterized protein YbgA (DUF1722 family)/uncharacterized protein YbbK (DUF523 family)
MPDLRPQVGVSSCLLGQPVRHNGGHSRSRFLTDELGFYVDFVPVCPEIEIGLGTPRPALRLMTGGRLVTRDSGADHTAAVAAVEQTRRERLGELSGYVFKGRSPSCALVSAREYQADHPVSAHAAGAFAGRLLSACPWLPAEEDGRLNDPVLREAFVERIFARARLLAMFGRPWRLGDLVDFHSRHKLQLLAHDRAGYGQCGRLVAGARLQPRAEVAARYRAAFEHTLSRRPSTGRHADVLQHAFGMISSQIDDARRHDILAKIEAYRRHEVPLSVPVALISHHAAGQGAGYLANQTYLDPFPPGLGLRNHS